MLFSEPFRQERIPNRTRKRNVDDSAIMHMSDFSISEAKLTTSEAMGVDRDLGPGGNDVFQILQLLHKSHSVSVGCTSAFARFMPQLGEVPMPFRELCSHSQKDYGPKSFVLKSGQFERDTRSMLGMIGAYAKVGEQQLLAARMVTSAIGFDGYENGVNIFQGLRIVGLQNPALLADIIFIEDAKTESLLLVRSFPAPGLKGLRILKARLCIQIEGIKDQRLSFCVEHATVSLVRSRF